MFKKIKADDWLTSVGPTELAISPKERVELYLVSTGKVTLCGVSLDGTVIPIAAGETFSLRNTLEGFKALQFNCGAKDHIGMLFTGVPLDLQEKHNLDAPPPPPEKKNALAKLREARRQQMGVMREHFIRPSAEIDDNDYEFEEELVEKAKKLAEDSSRDRPSADPTPPSGTGGKPEPTPSVPSSSE